jgi:hypothetical protein
MLSQETWLIFSWNSSGKVKQAYDWSNNVEVWDIPNQFNVVRDFLLWFDDM